MVAIQIINPILTRISSRSNNRILAPGALPEASLRSLNLEHYPETLPDSKSEEFPDVHSIKPGIFPEPKSGNVSG